MSWCGGRDQGHPGWGVPEAGDLGGNLGTRKLPALAGLGPLGHLDLQLVGERAVLGGHPEPARRHLLDARVPPIPVAGPVLASLTGVGPPADHVQGHRHRLVGLGRERPVGHRPGREATGDRRRVLDVRERRRRAGRRRFQEIPGGRGGPTIRELGEPLVGGPAAAPHRPSQLMGGPDLVGSAGGEVQRSDHLGVVRVVLAAGPVLDEPGVVEGCSLLVRLAMTAQHVPAELSEPDPAQRRRRAGET
jgi:hypothetical protein